MSDWKFPLAGFCQAFNSERYNPIVHRTSTMLLLSLCIVFLSPMTIFSVASVSLPKVESFQYSFGEDVRQKIIKIELELRCVITGFPKPKLEFQFNGSTIKNSSRVTLIDDLVRISEVQHSADEGVYTCVATNANGKVFKEKFIKIKSFGEFLPGYTLNDPPKIHDVVLGESFELFCPKHSYAYPLNYYWGSVHNGIPSFEEDSRNIHITNKGHLLLSAVTKAEVDRINKLGGISCIVKMGGDVHPKFIHSRKNGFRVTGTKTRDIAPSIQYHFYGKIYAEEGESVTLNCYVTGNPIPNITWFRNGVQILSNDSRYEINAQLPTKLTIRNVNANMVGQFKCVAANRAGKDEKYGRLVLAEPPTMKVGLPTDVTVPQRKKLRLLCSAAGTEPMTYQWYRNGSLLSSYSYEGVSMSIKDGELTINSINYTDAGMYQCTAKNNYGSKSSVGYVRVTKAEVIDEGTTGKHNNGSVDNKDKNDTNNNNGANTDTNDTTTTTKEKETLTTQHIVIIACGGSVFLILVGGAIFMCCRTKNDAKEIRFIPTPRHETKPMMIDIDLPPPPRSLTDSDYEDDVSSFGGVKLNAPEFIQHMSEIRSRQSPQKQNTSPGFTHNSEHIYYGIPGDQGHELTTPSTDL